MGQKAQRGYVLDPERLRRFCAMPLEKVGMSAEDARIAAEVLVRSDLRGIHTHGAWRLPAYVKRMQSGGVDPKAQFQIVRETATTALVDGNAGLGHVIAVKAAQLGIKKASSNDVGVILVRNSNHFGAAGHYALMCAEAGYIGIVLTNTPPVMKVTGARGRVLGNGPTAYGFPNAGAPIVLDIAMSVVAGSNIVMAAERGDRIPEGWLVNSDGLPTTDPGDLAAGALVPIGDHKGYGITLLGELLAGALSGAATGSTVAEYGMHGWPIAPETPWNIGHAFIVLKVTPFMPLDDFKARVVALSHEIQNSPRAPGVDHIYVPGEIEDDKEQERLREGIGFDSVTWNTLATMAREFNLMDVLEQAQR